MCANLPCLLHSAQGPTLPLGQHGHAELSQAPWSPGARSASVAAGIWAPTCTPYCVNSALLHFLPSSCQSAVVWVWDENNDSDTLMFQLLGMGLGVCGAGRGCSQDSTPQLAKRNSHSTWHHAHQKNGERKLAGVHCLGTGWASLGGWWAGVFYLHHLFFLGFISLSLFILIFIMI